MSRFLHRAALACATVAVTALPLASPASAVGVRETTDLSCSMGQTEALVFKNNTVGVHDFTVTQAGAVIATSGPVAGGASAPVVQTSALQPGTYQTQDVSGAAIGNALAGATLTITTIDLTNRYILGAC
jgi:hypothetical protein